MNLYIWGNSGNVSYGADCIVVLASSLPEARKLIKTQCADWSFGRDSGTAIVSSNFARKPDKVIRNRGYAAYFMVCE